MSAPPLTRLRTENGQAAGPAEPEPLELPPELWVKILMAVQMDDPCREVIKWCETEKKWAKWCRDGTLYEAANRKLGWYGDFASLQAMQAHAARSDFPIYNPPPTAKQYFQEACKAMRRARSVTAYGVTDWLGQARYADRPYYDLLVKQVMQGNPAVILRVPRDHAKYPELALAAVTRDPTVFRYISTTVSNYWTIARRVVETVGILLQRVLREPKDEFMEVARIAVQQNGDAIQYVSTDPWADYYELAKLAVQQFGQAIRHMNDQQNNYFELCTLAIQQNPDALEHVSTVFPRFHELANLAVSLDPNQLWRVPRATPHYADIAMTAVKRDGMALNSVSVNTDNYFEICMAAVHQNGLALRFVRHTLGLETWERERVDALFKAALKQNPLALEFVPRNYHNYEEVAIDAILSNNAAIRKVDTACKTYHDILEGAWSSGMMRPDAIRYLVSDYARYAEIVENAIISNPNTIKYMNKFRKDYWDILEGAVMDMNLVLEAVPTDDAEKYERLALMVMDHGSDPGALEHVPADDPRINYFKIARRAVMRDGRLLSLVPPSFPKYKELATIAIKQSKYALGYVPKDHECYAEMAALHEKRMTPPSPTHKYEYFHGYSWNMRKDV